jgi:sugar phosphate isomerase/epimerase
MNNMSRSEFITIFSSFMLVSVDDQKPKIPLLSFSTLGCPDWNLSEIINFAAVHDYNGVEIRGIQRELDLPLSKYFNSPTAIKETKKQFSDKGIKITDLGSSCELHHADPVKRQKNLDEGKRFTDLAAKLESPYIRVFPNNLPPDQDRNKTMELISLGLTELGNYAKGSNIKVLMETHGDLTKSDDLEKVMSAVESKNAGLVWDICNMWTITKEPPSVVYNKLKKYIFHTHIKDLIKNGDKDHPTFLGKGEVPIFEAIDLLVKNHYKGYFSFEWEKLWNPEIEAPELAFADYAVAMKKHF